MKQKILILLTGVLSLYGICVSANEREFCAIILHNSAKYSMETSLDDVFVRRSYNRKILINSDEGIRYASIVIPYYRFMEYSERVGGIKVFVSNGAKDEKGNLIVRQMPREIVQDVRRDANCREKRFTVPDVRPGDTIEIRYEVSGLFPEYYKRGYDNPGDPDYFSALGFVTKYGIGEDIVFPKWHFQEDIPVMESRLEVFFFDDYRIGYVLAGSEDIKCIEHPGGIYKVMQRHIVPRKHFSVSTGTATIISTGGIKPAFVDKELRRIEFSASNLAPLEEGERSL